MSDKPETLDAVLAELRARAEEERDCGWHGPAPAAPADELLSAILAEMRAARNTASDTTLVSSDWLDDWADRIEAAVKRERNAHTNDIHDALYKATGIPGNAAAMRGALENLVHRKCIVSGSCSKSIAEQCDHPSCVWYECRAALASPARNCDRPECRTRDEAWKVFERESAGMWAADWDAAFMAWLFDTKEGGAE